MSTPKLLGNQRVNSHLLPDKQAQDTSLSLSALSGTFTNFVLNVSDADRDKLSEMVLFYSNALYGISFPILRKFAQVILVFTAISVPSECLFSKSGLILTELRNRLNPEKLDKLTFLRSNMEH